MFEWGLSNATLFFGSVAVMFALAWRSWSTRRTATEGDQVLRLFLILVLAVLAVVSVPSLLAVQKWLTVLVMPTGLVWLGLTLVAIGLWRAGLRKTAAFVALLWILMTLAGNEVISRRLMASLERDFYRIDPLTVASTHEPFDLVVTLGGGTRVTAAGQVELTDAGDRVMLAARLFHLGHAQALAATGQPNVELLGPGRHPADETRRIWTSLGIPRSAILVLGGRTTKEEFEFIADEAQRRQWRRIGIVTSAWHMRRALSLAEAVDLNVEPLPADFIGVLPLWKDTHLVPEGQPLHETTRAMREYLARLVGR